jgi:hypothetical protein
LIVRDRRENYAEDYPSHQAAGGHDNGLNVNSKRGQSQYETAQNDVAHAGPACGSEPKIDQ